MKTVHGFSDEDAGGTANRASKDKFKARTRGANLTKKAGYKSQTIDSREGFKSQSGNRAFKTEFRNNSAREQNLSLKQGFKKRTPTSGGDARTNF